MELQRLYLYLKESPRDVRWLMRKVGPEYRERLDELVAAGWPVELRMEDVGGQQRAVYRAADQAELFSDSTPKRRRRKGRTPKPGRLL